MTNKEARNFIAGIVDVNSYEMEALDLARWALLQPEIVKCIFCDHVKDCELRKINSMLEFCSIGIDSIERIK